MLQNTKDQLRGYQASLVAEATDALNHDGSVVLQLPTGGGKTHIAVEIAKQYKDRAKHVWFVCHRREILKQTDVSFQAAGVAHGVLTSGEAHERRFKVQIYTIGTLASRLDQMDPPDLVIWDECHHIPARTWADVKRKLSSAQHLGLTATPDRLDGAGLRGAFNNLICGPDTRSLIEQGHLTSYRLFAPTVPDMRGVKIRMGDYAKGDVEETMNRSVLVGDVVEHYKRLTPDARAIAFACSVRASLAIVERFQAVGIPARHVDAKTSHSERDAAVEALRLGEIKVLSNVELFTEGFDLPAIDAVILLRPTKSFALYRQMVGRGLRPASGKVETVILDHAGCVHEHGLPDTEVVWTLDGHRLLVDASDAEGKARLRRCPECSAIHVWSPECVECGYAYGAKDRSIAEVYGELQEVSQLSGNVHPKGFPPGTFESRLDFAKRVGKPRQRITKWCDKGLPRGPNGWIEVEPALAWVERWNAARAKSPKIVNTKPRNPVLMGETIRSFCNKVGTKRDHDTLVRSGLPLHSDGSVNSEIAEQWIRNARTPKRAILPGYETKAEFARRIGVGKAGAMRTLIREGLPIEQNGVVHIETAIEWSRSNGYGPH